MAEKMSGAELVAMVKRVFQPRQSEQALAILIDLPDERCPDEASWAERRAMAAEWAVELARCRADLGMDTTLVLYPNIHTNNGDLPARVWVHPLESAGALPAASALAPEHSIPITELYAKHPILIALTKFSATAPLKMAAKQHPIRAATMPGFRPDMIPSLRLDYGEVNRRVQILKELLDQAEGASFMFETPTGVCQLHLDLRHRTGHASGGLIPAVGTAGNLPSGEAYIVPYEGERPDDASRSEGVLPVQFPSGEIVRYKIERNKAVAVLSEGPISSTEAALIQREPAYANLAELGLGVLSAFGVKPVNEILLDEKLGLHIAFGRSDHFGGQVGPAQFSSPGAVVHIDRVYVRDTQPAVKVLVLDLHMPGGRLLPLIRNWEYVATTFEVKH